MLLNIRRNLIYARSHGRTDLSVDDRLQFERRVVQMFDAMLDQLPTDRLAWLYREAAGDLRLVMAVQAMEAADSSAGALPTIPPEPAQPMEEGPPPARVGNYRIIREIGRGGMGIVFLAERADGLFEQKVAIKLIRPAIFSEAALTRFAAERRMLARIEHAGVARLIDGGVTEDGRPWLSTEYVEGTTVGEVCAGLGLIDRVRLFVLAAKAVQFAHGRLVAHGDIKPGNIMVGRSGEVKLLDFGIAALTDDEKGFEATPLTPAFASPERQAGAPPSTGDDIFALGRTLAELVADSGDAELAAIAGAAAAPADRRYSSVEALIGDLVRWQDRLPVSVYSNGSGYRLRKFVDRHGKAVLAMGLGLIALGGSLLVAHQYYRRAEAEHDVAAARFADTQRAAHYMMFELTDRLEHQPRTLRMRAQIYHRAQGYLDEMSQATEAPPAVKLDAVNGYLRAAAVSGIGNAPNFADLAVGKRNLDRAGGMLRSLAVDPSLRPALVEPDVKVASLTCQTKLYGDQDAGGALMAARQSERTIADMTRSPEAARAALWPLKLCEGDALVWMDRAREAIPLLTSELTAARQRGVPSDAIMMARNLRFLGEAYFYDHRYDEAVPRLAAALALLQREHEQSQFFQSAVNEYASVADDLATTYTNLGRIEDALRISRQGAELVRQQAALDPDDLQSLRRWLALERVVAASLAGLGRSAEAIALMETVDRQWTQLVTRFPGDAALKRLQIMSLQVRGDLLRRAHRTRQACLLYSQAADAWGAFGRRWHISPSDRRESIATDLHDVGACAGHGQFVDN